MLLEFLSHSFELLVYLGHQVLELAQVQRGTNAGDHILSLRVQQEVAERRLSLGGRVTRKANSGSGLFTCVAENHLHHIDRSTQKTGNSYSTLAGRLRPFRPSKTRRRPPMATPKLFFRVFREVSACLFVEICLVFPGRPIRASPLPLNLAYRH